MKQADKVKKPTTGIASFFSWFREKHNLSVREAAKRLGVSAPYLSRVERGEEVFPYQFCQKTYKKLSPEEQSRLYQSMVETVNNLLSGKKP